MKIFTITLNPAFDIHCNIENLQLHKENYATSVTRYAGGKGINISRALCGVGINNTAICALGTSGGEEFLATPKKDGLCCRTIVTEGRIRENITVHSQNGETRISFEGFNINKEMIDKVYAMIQEQRQENMIVTFTGRLCDGITKDDAKELLLKIKEIGAKVIVDCNSFTKADLLNIKPFLIKPNEQEISQLLGEEIKESEQALKAAKSLCDGGIENVIISLGAKGFVFWGRNGGYCIEVPQIVPVSTIGAGDSLIAGFTAGMARGENITETLKLAAAFGTAACLTEGTNPPKKEVIAELIGKIVCSKCVL